MAEAPGILGQSVPAAGVLTDIYSPTTKAVVSSITFCNLSAVDTSFRLSVAKAAAADAPKQYVYHDLPLIALDTFIATIGVTLAIGDVVRGYSPSGQVAFNLFGVEIT